MSNKEGNQQDLDQGLNRKKLTRRALLSGLVAGGGAALLAACGQAAPSTPAAAPTAAPAAAGATSAPAAAGATTAPAATTGSGTVVVATWGGDYQKLLGENIEQPILSKQSITVSHDIGDVPTRKTKLRAEKDASTGTLDVVHFGGPDMYEMYRGGFLLDLDQSKIPNWPNINSQFVNNYSIPHIYSARVILYNTQNVTPAPDSYAVFWDPKYKGRVGILETNWTEWLEIASQLSGGSPTNYEPGKEKLMELKANEPQIFASQEKLAEALKAGDVWLNPNWRARGVMWQRAGMPIATVSPKEGGISILFRAAIPKNAPNKDIAYAYLNAMLDPTAQLGFGDKMGYIPTVTNATLKPEDATTMGFTAEEQQKFFPQDFDYIATNQSTWQEWWQKNFLA